ncbi:MAG: AtpZ/AtpI family protein [Thermodesulfobacteriota bacterium]|nr:AtpZ/AtpI family protein [Thermodesulfobacteriota bacterium]
MDKGTKKSIKILAIASTMGLAMVLATVIGLAIGYYLDSVFDTSPWLTLIFLILGIIAGFRNLYIIQKRVQRMDEEPP